MSQNHRPAAPANDPTKKSSLFEVPPIRSRIRSEKDGSCVIRKVGSCTDDGAAPASVAAHRRTIGSKRGPGRQALSRPTAAEGGAIARLYRACCSGHTRLPDIDERLTQHSRNSSALPPKMFR